MKIIFRDTLSVFNRPDVEHQFTTKDELDELLSKYDRWQYAYFATIYDDAGKEFMKLSIDGEYGHFLIDY